MFITDADLTTVINENQLAQIVAISQANRNRSEHYAINEAKSYLNFQYDTDKIFGYEAFDYSNSVDYKEGQIIIDSSAIGYTCIQDATAGTALTDATYFEERDDRNPLIVMIAVDLLAYHLFSKTGANRIPQHIIDRYEQATKKLKDIRMSKMNPYLPLKQLEEGAEQDPNTQTQTMKIISNNKRSNFYD